MNGVRLVLGAASPRCPRCGNPGLLSALVPHRIENARGDTVQGRAVAVLCAHCDIDDPRAGALISFLIVNGKITDETVAEAGDLITAWVQVAKPKPLDLDELAAENEQWLRGEL